jgi:hypothetical protein
LRLASFVYFGAGHRLFGRRGGVAPPGDRGSRRMRQRDRHLESVEAKLHPADGP